MSQERDEMGMVRVLRPVVTQTAPVTGTAYPQLQAATMKLAELNKRIATGGSCFYWIAAWSLLNTVVHLCGGDMSFLAGLGITRVLDALAKNLGGGAVAVAGVVGVIIAGIYVMFGYFSCRRAQWAFITGIVLYALDALICLIAFQVFSIAFHLCALYCIVRGLQADNAARQLDAQHKWAQN